MLFEWLHQHRCERHRVYVQRSIFQTSVLSCVDKTFSQRGRLTSQPTVSLLIWVSSKRVTQDACSHLIPSVLFLLWRVKSIWVLIHCLNPPVVLLSPSMLDWRKTSEWSKLANDTHFLLCLQEQSFSYTSSSSFSSLLSFLSAFFDTLSPLLFSTLIFCPLIW